MGSRLKIPNFIVAFEGTDKTGKDTLINNFHKATNYIYPCINRFSGTSFAYSKYHKRNLDCNIYPKIDFSVANSVILIYLYVSDKKIITQRFKKHNETDIDLKRLKELQKYYKEYLNLTPLRTLKLDTSKLTIKQCIKEIISFIKQIEKESVINKVKSLEHHIKINGNVVDNTKEIQNVFINIKKVNESELICHLKEHNLLNYSELTEYSKIYTDLRNTIRLKTKYFKNQTLNSRQFVHHSDSCISFYQILKRNNTLFANVTIRSSNVSKMLLLDILGIYKIAKLLNEEYFKCKKIEINLNIMSAHIFKK